MPQNTVVLTVEKPDRHVITTDTSPPPALFLDKQKPASPKQLTWVFLLRLQRTITCVSRLSGSARTALASAKKRLSFSGAEPKGLARPNSGRLYNFIRVFLALSIAALVVELFAYTQNWTEPIPINYDLIGPYYREARLGLARWSYAAWLSFRADYVAPAAILLSKFCTGLFLIQSLDRLVLCLGCLWIKYKKFKPKVEVGDHDHDDIEAKDYSSCDFPKVLVQIPMCNEKEVYAQSISAVCQLDWPREKILIQVLDDSSDNSVQFLIKEEVSMWSKKGINILYRHRLIRTGYKAGNLKSAMSCDYVKDYEFVAIFDADFQPNSDFLKQTIPHFKGKPEVGLVQARWSFVNKDENLLTRLQNINLCFHFEVEQQVNGAFLGFFGFNGTAGVWRIKALEDSGGWLERTTVEDMDIAVRAHLNGWKFVFLNDVRVLCELPESYEAYKKQQHRWHSGPMQLFRLCLPSIITSKISIWKKANLIFLFFLLRKLILPFYSFTLFCVILPLTMFIPEAELPLWVICYVPILVSLLNVVPAPKSFPFLVPYLLFENTMSVTKFNAMVSGLFQLGSAYEWVVTKKTGRSSESDLLALEAQENNSNKVISRRFSDPGLDNLLSNSTNKIKVDNVEVRNKKKANKVYKKELALACLLLTASARSLLSAHGLHFYFLLFQGLSFLVVGLDLIGEQIS